MALYFRTAASVHAGDVSLVLHLTVFAALVQVVEHLQRHGRGRGDADRLEIAIRTYLSMFKNLYSEEMMLFKFASCRLRPCPLVLQKVGNI